MSGDEVRKIRKWLGLAQPGFADLVGVHRVTVARWETGAVNVPEPTARLIRILGKSAPRPKGRR